MRKTWGDRCRSLLVGPVVVTGAIAAREPKARKCGRMRIAMIGSGYVGLVFVICLADFGIMQEKKSEKK